MGKGLPRLLPPSLCGVCMGGRGGDQSRHSGSLCWAPSPIHILSPPTTTSPTTSYQPPDSLSKSFICLRCLCVNWMMLICDFYMCFSMFGSVCISCTYSPMCSCRWNTGADTCVCGPGSKWHERNIMVNEHLHINRTWYIWQLGVGIVSGTMVRVLFLIYKEGRWSAPYKQWISLCMGHCQWLPYKSHYINISVCGLTCIWHYDLLAMLTMLSISNIWKELHGWKQGEGLKKSIYKTS